MKESFTKINFDKFNKSKSYNISISSRAVNSKETIDKIEKHIFGIGDVLPNRKTNNKIEYWNIDWEYIRETMKDFEKFLGVYTWMSISEN